MRKFWLENTIKYLSTSCLPWAKKQLRFMGVHVCKIQHIMTRWWKSDSCDWVAYFPFSFLCPQSESWRWSNWVVFSPPISMLEVGKPWSKMTTQIPCWSCCEIIGCLAKKWSTLAQLGLQLLSQVASDDIGHWLVLYIERVAAPSLWSLWIGFWSL